MTKGDLRGFDKAVKRQEALAQNSKDLMTKTKKSFSADLGVEENEISNLKDGDELILVRASQQRGLEMAREMERYDLAALALIVKATNDIAAQGGYFVSFADQIICGEGAADEVAKFRHYLAAAAGKAHAVYMASSSVDVTTSIFTDGVLAAGVGLGIKRNGYAKKEPTEGDSIIGICTSSTAGIGIDIYSKVILEDMRNGVNDYIEELDEIAGEAMITPPPNYANLIQKLYDSFDVKDIIPISKLGLVPDIAAVTGGEDKIKIQPSDWEYPKIIKLMQKEANLTDDLIIKHFNAGIGLAIIVDEKVELPILLELNEMGVEAYSIGKIIK